MCVCTVLSNSLFRLVVLRCCNGGVVVTVMFLHFESGAVCIMLLRGRGWVVRQPYAFQRSFFLKPVIELSYC